jgi:hypothetical protein
MTEHQREEEFLSELLDLPESTDNPQSGYMAAHATGAPHQPILTRRDEQALLKAANQVGTPTLAPQESGFTRGASSHSFADEVVGLVRKYPLPALLVAAGIGYLLMRQRR